MSEDLIRAIVLMQPFFWIWVLEDEKRFDILNDPNGGSWFYVSVYSFIAGVIIFGISFGFYTSELLVVYALLVGFGVFFCRKWFYYSRREAIAISFLVTYLNSWYWEGVLHVWAIMENGLNINQIFQMLHLIPAIYFLYAWDFEKEQSLNNLMIGWGLSGILTFMRKIRIWKFLPMVHSEGSVYFFNHGLMIVNRFICLYFLLRAIVGWGISKKSDYPKFFKQRMY